eukprot:11812096-Heterocapsa_arctica.AAC.1
MQYYQGGPNYNARLSRLTIGDCACIPEASARGNGLLSPAYAARAMRFTSSAPLSGKGHAIHIIH